MIVVAVGVTLLTTPLYQASTRIFTGTLSSQQRILSYIQLITGETLAQRTIDKLKLNMSVDALRSEIRATSPAETVLINVTVSDRSPTRAKDIANTVTDEFVKLVGEIDTLPDRVRPDGRVIVEQRATLPNRPVTPKPARNLTLGFTLGVLLGVSLAIVRDRLAYRVKNRSPSVVNDQSFSGSQDLSEASEAV